MRYVFIELFFYKQKTAYEMRISDWSRRVLFRSPLAIVDGHLFTAAHAFQDGKVVFGRGDQGSALHDADKVGMHAVEARERPRAENDRHRDFLWGERPAALAAIRGVFADPGDRKRTRVKSRH